MENAGAAVTDTEPFQLLLIFQCSVTFRVTGPVSAGDTLHILGSHPTLGSWHAQQSIAMSTNPEW
jgi:Starch binding domain